MTREFRSVSSLPCPLCLLSLQAWPLPFLVVGLHDSAPGLFVELWVWGLCSKQWLCLHVGWNGNVSHFCHSSLSAVTNNLLGRGMSSVLTGFIWDTYKRLVMLPFNS